MIYRVKQFFRGVSSYVTNYDMTLVDEHLSEREKEVFMKLPKHEILHALSTANTIKGLKENGDEDVLIKAALLHDIGKVNGRVGIIKKSIMVVLERVFPKFSKKFSTKFSMFDVYYNHPELGAGILEDLETDERVILLVRYHHSLENADIKGMEKLKKADSSN